MEPTPVLETVEQEEDLSTPLTWIDTHAHLHFSAYAGEVDKVLHRAREAEVQKIITVGVNTRDSQNATELAATYENIWATVGIHPHDAGEADQGLKYLRYLAGRRKVVAIGECGLDFFKSTTTPEEQERALRLQLELAQEMNLPVVFHVREAFDQFFKTIDDYRGMPGVVHSFTADVATMESVIERGLKIALNGIMTFTKDPEHQELVKQIPADQLILETDCPFLSPVGYRGKQNEPARVADIGLFIAEARGQSPAELAEITTANAIQLFKL